MARLIINLDIEDADTEEQTVEYTKSLLKTLNLPDDTQVALVRIGDRSGGNLLLPKLSGRFGEHYQGRKANVKEVV